MKFPHPVRNRKSRRRGYSLAEVTLSIGIVSAVILPTLALLSSVGRIHQISVDQRVASSIARNILSDLENSILPNSYLVRMKESGAEATVPVPTSAGNPAELFLIADSKGQILEEIDSEVFQSSILGNRESLYAIRISMEPVNSQSDIPWDAIQVRIAIQSPSSAAEASREQHLFSTLLAAP